MPLVCTLFLFVGFLLVDTPCIWSFLQVIGAGMAGIGTAWALRQYTDCEVVVFERHGNVGGLLRRMLQCMASVNRFLQSGRGSVRLRFVHGTVRVVPVFGSDSSCGKGFSVLQYSFKKERHGSGSGFGFWKTGPAVPVPVSVPGKPVQTVPVYGSGAVLGPSCSQKDAMKALVCLNRSDLEAGS